MNNKDNITISKYINGELAEDELTAFEKLLQQDKALNEEVNFHIEVDTTLAANYQAINKIDEGERLEFEGILSKVMDGEEMVEKPMPKRPSLVRRLFPLATLAAAAAVLFFMISSPKLSDVADQYYSPYLYQKDPNLLPKTIIDEGIKAYQNEDYETALNIFINNQTGDLKLHLAKGNAEYNVGKYDEAIATFNFVIERTGNQSFKNYANWYAALTYLKKKDKGEAIQHLKKLPESADFYNQAQDLLKKLS